MLIITIPLVKCPKSVPPMYKGIKGLLRTKLTRGGVRACTTDIASDIVSEIVVLTKPKLNALVSLYKDLRPAGSVDHSVKYQIL